MTSSPTCVNPLSGARGTAAMDPGTRQEGWRARRPLAVSRNKQHMADIGRKGGQSVSKNREHMAEIGRKKAGRLRAAPVAPAAVSGGRAGRGGTPPAWIRVDDPAAVHQEPRISATSAL